VGQSFLAYARKGYLRCGVVQYFGEKLHNLQRNQKLLHFFGHAFIRALFNFNQVDFTKIE
jgi:hypothetical protein